jgi:hypothetical protein
MTIQLLKLWDDAAEMDATLRLPEHAAPSLAAKRIRPEYYSRTRLFNRISKGRVCIFRDLKLPVQGLRARPTTEQICGLVERGFTPEQRARVQVGRERKRLKMRVGELLRRWSERDGIVSVTDLHFRGSRFEDYVDISPISDFNVLCTDPVHSTDLMPMIEIMTMVISTRGNVSDSHTDDCDGSNHSFVGKKLWLAWDRVEGQKFCLQDDTRDPVVGQAAFDIETFLALPSSCWFLVRAGETLFLPGNMAHKVVTLEDYIGIGSFNVTLPGALPTLVRWKLHGTTDVHRKRILGKITDALTRRVLKLKRAPTAAQTAWGLPFLQRSARCWIRETDAKIKQDLLRDPRFKSFLNAALTA